MGHELPFSARHRLPAAAWSSAWFVLAKKALGLFSKFFLTFPFRTPGSLSFAHLPAPRGIGLSSRPIAKQTDSLLVSLLTDLLWEPYLLLLSLLLLDHPPSI